MGIDNSVTVITRNELEVVSCTRDSLMLIRGRCLFIYELKLLELQALAQGIPGEKLDLEWPKTQEKARGA